MAVGSGFFGNVAASAGTPHFQRILIIGVFNGFMHMAVWWLRQDSHASQCLAAVGVIGLSMGKGGTPTASHLFTCFSGWHWIFKAQWLL